jgi:hypothetical protein
LPKYYLNGNDAFRLKLWIPEKEAPPAREEQNPSMLTNKE